MSLSVLLANSLNFASDDGGPWRQYVLDHIDWLKARTKTFEVDALLMNDYRYDLARFLKEKNEFRLQLDLAWIVLLMNDLPNDMAFFEPGTYYIPTDQIIQDLYHSYATTEARSQ